MNDEYPREAIRELPQERARPGFTGRVMARLDEPGATSGMTRPGRTWAAAAAVVLFAVAGFGGLRWQAERRAERRADAARTELAVMQVEHARLAAELAALRRNPAAGAPVLVIGGDDRGELVIDLDRLARAPRSGPAVQRTSGRVER